MLAPDKVACFCPDTHKRRFCAVSIVQMAKESNRKRGLDRPSIIMVNSFAGKVPLKYMSAFTASKYALAGFTEVRRCSVLSHLTRHTAPIHLNVALTLSCMNTSTLVLPYNYCLGTCMHKSRLLLSEFLRSNPNVQRTWLNTCADMYNKNT